MRPTLCRGEHFSPDSDDDDTITVRAKRATSLIWVAVAHRDRSLAALRLIPFVNQLAAW